MTFIQKIKNYFASIKNKKLLFASIIFYSGIILTLALIYKQAYFYVLENNGKLIFHSWPFYIIPFLIVLVGFFEYASGFADGILETGIQRGRAEPLVPLLQIDYGKNGNVVIANSNVTLPVISVPILEPNFNVIIENTTSNT